MFAATIDDPRYGVAFVEHHLTGEESVAALRQWIMNGIKLVRAQCPVDWERRPDVEALRAWLDLLAADEWSRGVRQGSVGPVSAATVAVARDDFGLAAFARSVRRMTDQELLYCRLAYRGETGRRGEALREVVEDELSRRPWLIEVPEDTSEYDPALY